MALETATAAMARHSRVVLAQVEQSLTEARVVPQEAAQAEKQPQGRITVEAVAVVLVTSVAKAAHR
ncbi:MAG TPA: hypothetical protein VM639_00830 [Dongiaceae bacterium]|nr:hypothetical protein [Dongiaceae bacterium]